MNLAPSPSLFRARLSTALMFFLNGLLMASWFGRASEVKRAFALEDGLWGFIVLATAFGMFSAMPLAANWIGRFGSHRLVRWGGWALCLLVALIPLWPHPLLLAVGLLGVGLARGVMDVSMNAQAIDVERHYARPILLSLHGMYAVGNFVGAGLGSLMSAFNISLSLHLGLVALLSVVLVTWGAKSALVIASESTRTQTPAFMLPHRAVWLLGAIAFCSILAEGSMADWTGIYLREAIGAEASVAAAGFAVYSLFVTLGRLTGDRVRRHLSARAMLSVGSLLAVTGYALALFFPTVLTTFIGFSMVGLGISVVVPTTFSLAGQTPNLPPAIALAGASTIGFAGLLAGPVLVGTLAQNVSLGAAFSAIAIAVLCITLLSQRLR